MLELGDKLQYGKQSKEYRQSRDVVVLPRSPRRVQEKAGLPTN